MDTLPVNRHMKGRAPAGSGPVHLGAEAPAYRSLYSLAYKHTCLLVFLYTNSQLYGTRGCFSKEGCCPEQHRGGPSSRPQDGSLLRPVTLGLHFPALPHSSLGLARELLIHINNYFKSLISSHFSFE